MTPALATAVVAQAALTSWGAQTEARQPPEARSRARPKILQVLERAHLAASEGRMDDAAACHAEALALATKSTDCIAGASVATLTASSRRIEADIRRRFRRSRMDCGCSTRAHQLLGYLGDEFVLTYAISAQSWFRASQRARTRDQSHAKAWVTATARPPASRAAAAVRPACLHLTHGLSGPAKRSRSSTSYSVELPAP